MAGGSNGQTCLETVEIFDVHTGIWRMLPAMGSKRNCLGLCALANTGAHSMVVVAVGGQSDERTMLDSAEMLTIGLLSPISTRT